MRHDISEPHARYFKEWRQGDGGFGGACDHWVYRKFNSYKEVNLATHNELITVRGSLAGALHELGRCEFACEQPTINKVLLAAFEMYRSRASIGVQHGAMVEVIVSDDLRNYLQSEAQEVVIGNSDGLIKTTQQPDQSIIRWSGFDYCTSIYINVSNCLRTSHISVRVMSSPISMLDGQCLPDNVALMLFFPDLLKVGESLVPMTPSIHKMIVWDIRHTDRALCQFKKDGIVMSVI